MGNHSGVFYLISDSLFDMICPIRMFTSDLICMQVDDGKLMGTHYLNILNAHFSIYSIFNHLRDLLMNLGSTYKYKCVCSKAYVS